jgi:hypothetical protein
VELVFILLLLAFLVLLSWAVYSFLTSPGHVYLPNSNRDQRSHLPSKVNSGFTEETIYEREAQLLAREIGIEPNPEESPRAFIERMTSNMVLSQKDEIEASSRSSFWTKRFESPDENLYFYRLMVLGEKKISEFKTHSEIRRKNLWSQKLAEEANVLSQVREGRPIKYDKDLLSEVWVEQIKAQARKTELEEETARIRAQFLENLDFEPRSDILSRQDIANVRQEVFQSLRNVELERLKRLLELGSDFDGDPKLVSVQDWKDLKSEFDDVRNVWLRNRRRPSPQPYGVSPFGAEQLVADWLLFLGCKNVHVTQPSQDDGIDIFADEYVCQVKNYSTQLVSVNEVREIFGVSAMVGKRAMLFASTGLTASAAKFAEEADIPAIKFVVETSELMPLNAEAEKFLAEGMYQFPG